MRVRLVVLDRDGVINEDSDAYIKSPSEWQPIPDSLEAIAALGEHGYQVVVFTNQSGVGRGLFDLDTLEQIHAKMLAAVQAAGGALAGVYYCPHSPEDVCECRKPRTGLLRAIERDFGHSLAGCPVIGDSARDLEAAAAVGARPILVTTGKGAGTLADSKLPVESYADLRAAVEALLAESGEEEGR